MLLTMCGASLLLGAGIGRALGKVGIDADFEVEAKSGPLLLGVVLLGGAACGLTTLDRLDRLSWLPYFLPSDLLLYVAAHFTDGLFLLSGFTIGILVALEMPAWQSLQRRWRLLVALVAISCASSLLLHFARPVAALVDEPTFEGSVMMQTTPYTCAPTSIANLTRYLGTHPNLTEGEAARIAGTNRFGTSTLDQLRTLDRLGLKAQYEYGLTLSDLARRQAVGILNVREPYEEGRISHAVALLDADPEGKFVLIANPLIGLQYKTREDLEGYWFGEAILVQS